MKTLSLEDIERETAAVELLTRRMVAAQLVSETTDPDAYNREAIRIMGEWLRMDRSDQLVQFLVVLKANTLNYLAAHPEAREAVEQAAMDAVHAERAERR